MFVYIWKTVESTPFYVGCTKFAGRTNPRNSGNRNWLCVQKINEVGYANIVVEIRHVDSLEEGRSLETQLIEEYGRISLGTGTLTNLRVGGEGLNPMSDDHKAKIRAATVGRKKTPEQLEKHRKRMQDPDVQAKLRGENNPAKRPEVRAKLKALWANDEFRAARVKERKRPRSFSDTTLADLRKRAVDPNSPMSTQHKILNSDPAIKEKRLAGLAKAQDKIKAKLNDPNNKLKRIAALKATISSPEYTERHKASYTPEVRKKIADAKKAYWAGERAERASSN